MTLMRCFHLRSRQCSATAPFIEGESGPDLRATHQSIVRADPTLGLIHLTNVIANQGALPIRVGDEVIGAAGASGAPGGEKDEACVKAGIDKVADQLN